MKPEKHCPICGKPVNRKRGNAVYCSPSCAKKANTVTDLTDCPYGSWLRCRERNCATCGFHPEVEARRKKALEERYGTG